MKKRSRDISIILPGLRVLACCKKIYFGKGALVVLVACTLVLWTHSVSFSAPKPPYAKCQVYIMSNFQYIMTTTAPNFGIYAPIYDEVTGDISFKFLGPNTNREPLYYAVSQDPMGRIYYWSDIHKRWIYQGQINFHPAYRKSEFHAFEASASSWAGAVLPFGSDPNEIFPNGCSDLPSQKPDQTPNIDTGRPECNDQVL